MKAMTIQKIASLAENPAPLSLVDRPVPEPGEKQVLLRVMACGVCHTELDEIEGRTPPPEFPIIPGHQIVGQVEQMGKNASRFKINDRVGIAWVHSACGKCAFCKSGKENLCTDFKATGRDAHGGYAEYTTVPESYAYLLTVTTSCSKFTATTSFTNVL